MTCPHPDCGAPLEGLGTFCHACGRYTADVSDRVDAEVRVQPDDRPEAEIQLAIRRAMETLGYHVSDLSQDRPTRQTPGIPDLWVMGHGRFTWAEVKRPKGRTSKHQDEWHRAARENGAPVAIWRHENDAIAWHKEAA